MKIETICATAALSAALLMTASAPAAITVHQQAAVAPAYATTLNFDEPGTPTGSVSSTFWLASRGISISTGVDTSHVNVSNENGTSPWLGTGNSANGSFGVFLDFNQDISSISFQAWGDAGPPSPFGGGFFVFTLDNQGNPTATGSFTGAWGGTGNTWYNITTTGGSTFRHLFINNNSDFGDPAYIDNLSWTVAPTPGCLTLLAVGGLVGRKRRRR